MIQKYYPLGDNSVIIQFRNIISEEVNYFTNAYADIIGKSNIDGVIEIIPAYNSLQVIYNPLKLTFNELISKLSPLEKRLQYKEKSTFRLVKVPVLYGNEYGMDIEYVAEYNKLSVDEVIRIHSDRKYLIYLMGFTPGFPYLGGMSDRIATPRLEKPRQNIPAGSVGIAGNQTGIYPIDSPGGWRIIGRTPLRLYIPEKDPPVLLEPGLYIQFYPIDKAEYYSIIELQKSGQYQFEISDNQI